MAPYFIRNLIPRREARDQNTRPLLEVLRTITWVQWAQFFSGYVLSPRATNRANCARFICRGENNEDGLLGLVMRLTSSACRLASLAFRRNSTRTKLLRL